MYYPVNVLVHQLIFWGDNNYPDPVYLKRFKKKPYHLNVLEFSTPPSNAKPFGSHSRIVAEEKRVSDITPLLRPLDSFSSRPVIINYSNLERVYKFTGNVALANMGKWEATLDTMVQTVKKTARQTDKPQYVYLNLPTSTEAKPNFVRLFSKAPSVLSRSFTTFEKYIEFKLAEWVIKGEGVLTGLGNIDNVYIILKIGNKGYLYLSQVLHSITQDIDFTPPEDYRLNGISYVNETVRRDMFNTMFNKITPEIDNVAKPIVLDEEGDVVEPKVVVKPIVINVDKVNVEPPVTPEEKEAKYVTDLEEEPITSEQDILKFKKALSDNKKLVVNGKNIKTVSEVKEIAIPKKRLVSGISSITAKSMETSALPNLDRHYINNVLESHMYKVMNAFSGSGLVLTDVKRRVQEDITGGYIEYKPTYTLVGGGKATETIRIPNVDEEGVFMSGDTRFRMRRQGVDQPIRKINSKRVGLNTYYGTLFVEGPTLAVDDFVIAFNRKIKAVELEPDYTVVRNNVYDPRLNIDDTYSRLSKHFESISVKSKKLMVAFNYADRTKIGDVKKLEKGGYTLVGTLGKEYIVLKDEVFYSTTGGNKLALGNIFDLFDMTVGKVPVDAATVKVLGGRVYVGMLLSYLYGITGLLKRMKVKYTIHPARKRIVLPAEKHILLKFNNGQLLITGLTKQSTMVLQGLVKYQSTIKDVSYADMDSREIYLELLSKDLKIRHIREFNLLDKQYIDPISEEVLTFLKKPTNFRELLLEAVTLLEDNGYPHTADVNYTRFRGYERFAGAAYTQIAKHLRVANSAINRKNRKLQMSPYAVWQAILQDDSKKTIEDTNPMVWMKEEEVVTVAGMGGRKSDSLTLEVRKFHPSMVGTIAEFVPDDGNVGMVSYLTSDPNIDNIYGIPKEIPDDNIQAEFTKNYSSGYIHAAGATFDD